MSDSSNQFKSIVDYLLLKEQEQANAVYLRQPHARTWHEYTWGEVVHKARQVAQFLKSQGLEPGDHVSIFSKNCAEWFITDFGITLAGLVNVPLFSNQHEDSIEYVLNHAEVKFVFIGKLDLPSKTRKNIPSQYKTASFDYHKTIKTDFSWVDVMAAQPLQDVHHPKPEALYTIIYSSGTTGYPKGIMFTHQAIANNLLVFAQDVAQRVSIHKKQHLLSYLPLAHVYERSTVQLASICLNNCDVSFVKSLDKFVANLQEVQPTLFTAVPRIWTVFKQRIEKKIPPKKLKRLLSIPIVSQLIKRKIRHQLGLSRCELIVSGAAHLPTEVLKFFNQLSIPIQEGYGQSENLAYATLSNLNARIPGYVGQARLGVDFKQADNGELLIKMPFLMKGYYKDPEATTKVLTDDGWLRTGDLVEIDEKNQNVKILGRLTETFKNQKGEFVSPTPIEDQFTAPDLLEYMCLVGRGLPSNILLVNLTAESYEKSKEQVKQHLKSIWQSVNPKLLAHEKISHIVVVPDSWTTDNGCLTPTQKVKRFAVEARYQDSIQKSIQRPSSVVWEA